MSQYGTPVEGAVLRVEGAEDAPAETLADGSFLLRDVDGESIRVEITKDGFERVTIDGVETDSVLPDIVLKKTADPPAAAMR